MCFSFFDWGEVTYEEEGATNAMVCLVDTPPPCVPGLTRSTCITLILLYPGSFGLEDDLTQVWDLIRFGRPQQFCFEGLLRQIF